MSKVRTLSESCALENCSPNKVAILKSIINNYEYNMAIALQENLSVRASPARKKINTSRTPTKILFNVQNNNPNFVHSNLSTETFTCTNNNANRNQRTNRNVFTRLSLQPSLSALNENDSEYTDDKENEVSMDFPDISPISDNLNENLTLRQRLTNRNRSPPTYEESMREMKTRSHSRSIGHANTPNNNDHRSNLIRHNSFVNPISSNRGVSVSNRILNISNRNNATTSNFNLYRNKNTSHAHSQNNRSISSLPKRPSQGRLSEASGADNEILDDIRRNEASPSTSNLNHNNTSNHSRQRKSNRSRTKQRMNNLEPLFDPFSLDNDVFKPQPLPYCPLHYLGLCTCVDSQLSFDNLLLDQDDDLFNTPYNENFLVDPHPFINNEVILPHLSSYLPTLGVHRNLPTFSQPSLYCNSNNCPFNPILQSCPCFQLTALSSNNASSISIPRNKKPHPNTSRQQSRHQFPPNFHHHHFIPPHYAPNYFNRPPNREMTERNRNFNSNSNSNSHNSLGLTPSANNDHFINNGPLSPSFNRILRRHFSMPVFFNHSDFSFESYGLVTSTQNSLFPEVGLLIWTIF